MGKYAVFIWSAYGICALVLIGLLLQSLRSTRQQEAMLESLRNQMPQRRRRKRSEQSDDA